MTKVLWVIHGAEIYGESRAIVSLMRGVRAAGWEVEALSLTEGSCYQQLVADGFRVTCIQIDNTPSMHLATNRIGKFWQFGRMFRHQFPVSRRVKKEIELRRPDVVHVLSKNILAGVAHGARRAGVPCFWEMTAVIGGDFWFGLNRRMYRFLLNRYRIQPLANSRYTAQTLGPLRRPALVMHLGADVKQFAPDQHYDITRAGLQIPAAALVYLIVSRIDSSKGQEVFLEAVRKVNDPRIHTVFVGDATSEADRAHFKKIRESLNPDEMKRVHFEGFSATPQAYIALSDVGVNARLDAEPFGLSVIEGMMMGKPMLVHALGGPAETVLDGQTGWHVKSPTVQAWTDGIRRSLNDHARWMQMGEAARVRALAEFSLEKQTQRYQNIVTGQLNQRPKA